MSARIVVNLEHGLAASAIDRGLDGGTWLSLWQGREVVIVKLSEPSLQALWLALTKELGMSVGETAPGDERAEASAAATKTGRGEAAAWRRPAAEAAPAPTTAERS